MNNLFIGLRYEILYFLFDCLKWFYVDDCCRVFPGEACDDLGGEFCEPEYQRGVH